MLGTPDAPGAYQPCTVTAEPGSDAIVDVHLFEDAAQLGTNIPAPLEAGPPFLSGRVFESTTEGDIVLSGARVALTDLDDTVLASTVTDASGRYQLCGVPQSSRLLVQTSHPGYFIDPVQNPVGQSELDIALRRVRR